MLHELIAAHRDLIIARSRERVGSGVSRPRPTDLEVEHGVALFLDQLVARLRGTVESEGTQIATGASLHGGELLKAGLTIAQVVQDYGNICQVITQLAVELRAQIPTEDFRTLNLCLDIAIAEAVTEFARQREATIIGQGVEQLGFLAHELRNLLNCASLAFEAVHAGHVGITGSTGRVLERSLAGMRDLINRSLLEVRVEACPPRNERILVADLFQEIELAATLHQDRRDVRISIEPSETDLTVNGDYQVLASIMTNLMQNACKFTHPQGRVKLSARVTNHRVLIDVADQCGGLPPGKAAEMFRPYQQHGNDRSGLGLGLAISLKATESIGGKLSVIDVPGLGCVFTVDLDKALPIAEA